MLNKVIAALMNWIVSAIFLPAMYFIYDVYKLRKENKELKKAIEDLKNAKTKTAIDSAVDSLP